MHASFKAKPLEAESGNGLHLKISLNRGGQLLDEINPDITTWFMAGVFHRMRDITVFLNTQVDSYQRFGQKEAPKYITWSSQNRSRLLRVPEVLGKRQGFILRSPDSAINPYLAFSMVIRAGMEGVQKKESLPAPLDISSRLVSDEEKKQFEKLPQSLSEAVDCAKHSSFLQSDTLKNIANRYIEVVEDFVLS